MSQVWTHRDVLRLCHANKETGDTRLLYKWVHKGLSDEFGNEGPWISDLPDIIQGFEFAKTADEAKLVDLIGQYGLTREMIPTEHQKSPKVWEALLKKMPLTAMIRTLGRMSSVGLLTPLSGASQFVAQRLANREYLRKSRVHPIQCLSALLTYKQGHGERGKLTWTPVPKVVDALNEAFYMAFDNVEPTNKRFYLGVDVSGSMTRGQVAGIVGLTPNMGAAAMAMLIARTEPNYFIGGFATQFVDLGISKTDRLDAACQKARRDFGGTDCAVAIKHALSNKVPVDAFVVISDGESWAGSQHSCQALVEYQRKTGIRAKLVMINMVANKTSLVDPTSSDALDVIGFDSSVPLIINQFIGAEQTRERQPEPESE